MTEDYEITKAEYRNVPCRERIWQVAFQLDNLELELISPANDAPSYWKDCLDRDGEGVHHIAFHTLEIDKELARLEQSGYAMIQKGSWPAMPWDGLYAYADTKDRLKCTVELLDYSLSVPKSK